MARSYFFVKGAIPGQQRRRSQNSREFRDTPGTRRGFKGCLHRAVMISKARRRGAACGGLFSRPGSPEQGNLACSTVCSECGQEGGPICSRWPRLRPCPRSHTWDGSPQSARQDCPQPPAPRPRPLSSADVEGHCRQTDSSRPVCPSARPLLPCVPRGQTWTEALDRKLSGEHTPVAGLLEGRLGEPPTHTTCSALRLQSEGRTPRMGG